MDLPQIGAHCSLSSCNTLDFLPITCKCSRSFCRHHISLDQHACPLLSATVVTSDLPTSSDQLPRCALDGCEKLSLHILNGSQSESCQACTKSFCVEHRHPDTHKCPSVTVEKEEANSKVSKPVAKPYKLARKRPPTDPVKFAQWQKVEVMKMRHRATPADPKDATTSLPPDQRLHVRIMAQEIEHIFWLRKLVVTGRALDLIVKQLKLTFPDHQPLKLFMVSHEEDQPDVPLQNDQVLATQVTDGCTLLIVSSMNS